MTERRTPPTARRQTTSSSTSGAKVEAYAQKIEELEERLDAVETERDEHLTDLRRVAADFDNYRKRVARDQENLIARAHERLVTALLPVLDDLERALEAAREHEETKLEEGVLLVERQLRDVLTREGLVEIETNGSFDPHIHEALLTQPSEEEDGAILDVLQKGYRLGDRVIRPARVAIAQGGVVEEAPEAEGEDGE